MTSASACSKSTTDVAVGFANCNTFLSNKITQFAELIENGDKSRLHYLWVVPINLAASLIGIALAPIAFLVNLLAGISFKIVACFFDSGEDKNHYNTAACGFIFVRAMAQLFCTPLILFIRIFNPSCSSKCVDPSAGKDP